MRWGEITIDKIQEKKITKRAAIKEHMSVHWRTQCHIKWPSGSRRFLHPAKLQDSLQLTLTINPWVHIDLPGKLYIGHCILQPTTDFFVYRIVALGLFKLNIKARHEIPEFLNAKTLIDTSYIDWSWNIFFLYKFYSMLIEQLINIKKVIP